MGRRDREHKLALINGTAKPFRQSSGKIVIRRCLVCNHGMPEHMVLAHAKECWGITYATMAEVPPSPPPEARAYYAKNHPEEFILK